MAYYFVSDTHLGLEIGDDSKRTQRFISFLEEISDDADAIFLLGDIFDFWFEYKRVIPKGYSRILGELARLTDRGVKIHFFTGNHDMWTGSCIEEEIGLDVHKGPTEFELYGKRLLLAHGDTEGRYDFKHRLLGSIFRSNAARKIFSCLVHPSSAMKFGQWWSKSNRLKHSSDYQFKGEDEPITKYFRHILKEEKFDYMVSGHLHSPVIYPIGGNVKLVVLGEWIENSGYGVFDGKEFVLKNYEK